MPGDARLATEGDGGVLKYADEPDRSVTPQLQAYPPLQ